MGYDGPEWQCMAGNEMECNGIDGLECTIAAGLRHSMVRLSTHVCANTCLHLPNACSLAMHKGGNRDFQQQNARICRCCECCVVCTAKCCSERNTLLWPVRARTRAEEQLGAIGRDGAKSRDGTIRAMQLYFDVACATQV